MFKKNNLKNYNILLVDDAEDCADICDTYKNATKHISAVVKYRFMSAPLILVYFILLCISHVYVMIHRKYPD